MSENAEKPEISKNINLEMIEKMKSTGHFPTIKEIEANIKKMENENMFTEEELLKAFKLYDENGDGSISYDELKSIISLIGENMTESELNEFIREGDSNLSGDLNYKEIINLISEKKKNK